MATGERSSLLFWCILPLVAIRHYRVARLSVPQFATLAGVLLLTLVSLRVLTRDVFGRSLSAAEAAAEVGSTIVDLPDYLYGNIELAQFDALAIQIRRDFDEPFRLSGSSITRMLLAPVPSAIAGDLKPPRGNIAFTREYYAWFYRGAGAGITVSYMGDWYMNFGAAGVVLGMLLAGIVLSVAYSSLPESPALVPMYALGASVFLLVLRGDLQDVALLFQQGAVLLFLLVLAWRPYEPPGGASTPG